MGGQGAENGNAGNNLLDLSADDNLLPVGGGAEGGLEGDSPPRTGSVDYAGPSLDLLDMTGFGANLSAASAAGGGGGGGEGASIRVDTPPTPPLASLVLVDSFQLDPEAFQQLWAELPEVGTYNVAVVALPVNGLPALEAALAGRGIACLASGEMPDAFKLFLYGQDERGDIYLVQALLQKAARRLEVTLKVKGRGMEDDRGGGRIAGNNEGGVEAFVDLISQALYALELI